MNFAWVLRQIVELRSRRVDEVIFCVLRAPEFTPVKVNPRHEGFSIEDAVARSLINSKLWKQAASLHLRRDLQPDSAQYRGHQIDERNRIGNRARRGILRQPSIWQSDDQR